MKESQPGDPHLRIGSRFSMSDMNNRRSGTSTDMPSSASPIPQRYVVKEIEGEPWLTCVEAPNLAVKVASDLTVSAATARKSPAGTIYLDGTAQCEPFMDHQKKIYNFDHHEGVVRPFTLATCEQVLVMILKGLDLRDRQWKIYANEPDLDAILAIWLMLNHQRIGRKESIHTRLLFSLVRLEGVIDAHGLELKSFSALPPDSLKKTQKVIDFLRKEEIQLKKDGLWEEVDLAEYTARTLHKIDRIIYKTREFSDFKGIKELARIDLTDDRIVAVVESDSGIYELESHLDDLYGDRLGLVVLKKSDGAYTIRRMDQFMAGDLEAVYERLNYVDAAVRNKLDNSKWGGSAEIGGSPRGVGSKLKPIEIAMAARDAMQKPKMSTQAFGLLKAALLAGGIVALAEILQNYWQALMTAMGFHSMDLIQNPDVGYALVLLTASLAILLLPTFHKWWQFGIAQPLGNSWWWLLPAVVICAVGGGLWLPIHWQSQWQWLEQLLTYALIVPLATEVLFRGLLHGLLAKESRVQTSNGPWFLSWPVVGSAFLYAAYIGFRLMSTFDSWDVVFTGWTTGNIFGAFAFGIAAGMVRERSQSLLPAVLFNGIAAAIVMLVVHLT